MSHIAPIPAPDAAAVPDLTPALDARGHDPAAYDWVPVLKKRRKDGWSPDKQRAFVEALADSGSVAEALVHLHPEPPAAPAALMAPDDLAVALEVADLCDGELPRWYRDDADKALVPPATPPVVAAWDEAELS